MPVPWRRMTAPWNTWTRSRVPSTTRTCTLTVSPGRNSGMSSRRLSRSMMSVGFMGRVSFGVRSISPPSATRARRSHQGIRRDTGRRCGHRCDPAPTRLLNRSRVRGAGAPHRARSSRRTSSSVSPPRAAIRSGRRCNVLTRDCARRQASTRPWSPERSTSGTPWPRKSAGRVYCGYSSSPAAKLSSSVDSLVAQDAGQEPGHGLDHHQGGQLAAGQHEVADRQLAVAQVVGHPLVDPLVAPAQQGEAAGRPGQLPGHGLVEAPAPRPTAGAAAGAGRPGRPPPPRPPRTPARGRAPCPHRPRRARRRPCGGRRGWRRGCRGCAGRAVHRPRARPRMDAAP